MYFKAMERKEITTLIFNPKTNKNELVNEVMHQIKGEGNTIDNLEWIKPPVITALANTTEASKLVCVHVNVLAQIRTVSNALNIR